MDKKEDEYSKESHLYSGGDAPLAMFKNKEEEEEFDKEKAEREKEDEELKKKRLERIKKNSEKDKEGSSEGFKRDTKQFGMKR